MSTLQSLFVGTQYAGFANDPGRLQGFVDLIKERRERWPHIWSIERLAGEHKMTVEQISAVLDYSPTKQEQPMNTFDVVILNSGVQYTYVAMAASIHDAVQNAVDAHDTLIGGDGVVVGVTMRPTSLPISVKLTSTVGDSAQDTPPSDTLPGWEWAVEHGYSVEAWEMTGKLLRLVWLGVDNITVADICDAVAPIMDTKIASSVIHYDWFDEDE